MTTDPLKILLVDDNADVRGAVRLSLEFDDRFSEIAEAANGREAIEVVEADPPDVILLDMMMPVMSGTEALPTLREAAPDARIVIFSAVADEVIDLTDGADAVVPKTIDLIDLCDTLAGEPASWSPTAGAR